MKTAAARAADVTHYLSHPTPLLVQLREALSLEVLEDPAWRRLLRDRLPNAVGVL